MQLMASVKFSVGPVKLSRPKACLTLNSPDINKITTQLWNYVWLCSDGIQSTRHTVNSSHPKIA